MSHLLILSIVAIYFIVLLGIAFYTARGAENAHFFNGKKDSNWLLVAYGMIGTSLSGVTFMSVPGKVSSIHFYYLQIVVGYLIGYAVVATVLLPLYYRLNLTSIYGFLQERFGNIAYKTGASFFLLSRTLGAALRIYLVLYVLHQFLLAEMGIPFAVSCFVILFMIVLYTFKGGVKTIVWTDTLQTTFMILSLLVTIWMIKEALGIGFGGLITSVQEGGFAQFFDLDYKSPTFFLKQIISGAFITIAMTGLDQEMMQKNISIRSLENAQKNMLTFSVILAVVNFLFVFLGASLYVYVKANNIVLTGHTDDTFPTIALQYLPPMAGIFFIVGLISALFPSADGAMTALTSSFCIDILNFNTRTDLAENKKVTLRKMVHISVAILFFLLLLLCKSLNEKAIIDRVLEIAGYTYGPLLGLFIFGMFTKYNLKQTFIPLVCIAAPILTFALKSYSKELFNGYQIGFETLPINGLITFLGLCLLIEKSSTKAH